MAGAGVVRSVAAATAVASKASRVPGTLGHVDERWGKHVASILPDLWLGSREAACNPALLKSLGVRACVNCCQEANFLPGQLRYLHVDVEDHPRQADAIAAHFAAVGPWVQRHLGSEGGTAAGAAAGGGAGVLIYCQRGVSRSCTILLAVLLHLRPDWSLYTAWQHVKRARSVVRPNPGFLQALMAYERRVRGECSVRVSKSGHGFAPSAQRTPAIDSNFSV